MVFKFVWKMQRYEEKKKKKQEGEQIKKNKVLFCSKS